MAIFICVSALSIKAQSQTVPFDSDRWQIQAKESRLMDHLGRKSLYLVDGAATVTGLNFTDGIIEFDIAVGGERGFMGVEWRMQDDKNYEEFYIRPHQSGNPDATQYHPVYNGLESWQLYYGEGYSAPVKFDFNQWMHFKIVVAGKNAEVYIKDMETPVLFVNELKRETKSGTVGVSTSGAPVYYSNFSFAPLMSPALRGKAKAAEPLPVGTVKSWLVSSVLEGKSLTNKYQLTATDKQKARWTKLDSDSTGVVNLARLNALDGDKNTVFARLIIQSDTEQVKKFRFGFSDEVKVYVNDRLIYAGSDVQRSRDYRFLGILGLFDELYLPLKKGDNEIWMAVTENFGGWGIKARFEDLKGINIKN